MSMLSRIKYQEYYARHAPTLRAKAKDRYYRNREHILEARRLRARPRPEHRVHHRRLTEEEWAQVGIFYIFGIPQRDNQGQLSEIILPTHKQVADYFKINERTVRERSHREGGWHRLRAHRSFLVNLEWRHVLKDGTVGTDYRHLLDRLRRCA